MVNLHLTDNEWYFLHQQMEKVIKECPDNHIAKGLLDKLAENSPRLDDIKTEFKVEYECRWIKQGG